MFVARFLRRSGIASERETIERRTTGPWYMPAAWSGNGPWHCSSISASSAAHSEEPQRIHEVQLSVEMLERHNTNSLQSGAAAEHAHAQDVAQAPEAASVNVVATKPSQFGMLILAMIVGVVIGGILTHSWESGSCHSAEGLLQPPTSNITARLRS